MRLNNTLLIVGSPFSTRDHRFGEVFLVNAARIDHAKHVKDDQQQGQV